MAIDSLAAIGAILADVWTDSSMSTVDNFGDNFLEYVKTGMKVTVKRDGTLIVDYVKGLSNTKMVLRPFTIFMPYLP